MSDILAVCVKAAKEAGNFLKNNFATPDLTIERKADQSLVTNLDKESERLIIDCIKQKFPSHGIIGEESGWESTGEDYLWIIDPLDGTHNFIRNINMFGVSIGVVHRNCFVAGVIYLPVLGELYTAETGGGAYKNDQKITVSNFMELADCTVSFDSGLKSAPGLKLRALRDIADRAFNIRMFGSSARQLSYLAEGTLDAIIEFDDYPWDFAAGACILAEAGGKITNIHGDTLTYKDRGFLASNGRVHQAMLEMLKIG